MSLKLAVLASGSGTNFQAMVDAVRRGALDADIRLVICNRPGAKVIERAKAAGIICAVMDHKLWPSREAYDLPRGREDRDVLPDDLRKAGAEDVEVIIQAAVPAIAGEPLDDLQSRIHAQEHRIYPQALQWLAEDRIKMDDDGRSLHLLPGSRPLAAPAPGVLVSPPLEEGF